jgi:hypothetical protein
MVKVDDMVGNVTGYLESRIEMLKLDVKNETSRAGVTIIVGVTVALFAFFFLICLTIALGLFLGDLVESRPLGFVLVAALFLILTVVLLVSKKVLLNVVQKRLFPRYSGK